MKPFLETNLQFFIKFSIKNCLKNISVKNISVKKYKKNVLKNLVLKTLC